MPEWLTILLIAGATYRATRLVVCDAFPPARAARGWIVTRGPRWVGDLVTCCWCAGVWVGAAIVALTDQVTSVPLPWLVGAVAASAAGWLGERDNCD